MVEILGPIDEVMYRDDVALTEREQFMDHTLPFIAKVMEGMPDLSLPYKLFPQTQQFVIWYLVAQVMAGEALGRIRGETLYWKKKDFVDIGKYYVVEDLQIIGIFKTLLSHDIVDYVDCTKLIYAMSHIVMDHARIKCLTQD